MLGGFTIEMGDRSSMRIRGKKSTALVGYLLSQPQHCTSRQKVMSLLWSQRSPEQARASLRQCLSDLRRQLSHTKNISLSTDNQIISLNSDDYILDIEEFNEIVKVVNIGEKPNILEIYKGEFLEGLEINDPAFNDWIIPERLKYKSIYTETLSTLLKVAMESGDTDNIFEMATEMLKQDNCDEEAHLALMKTYFLQGKKSIALAQFRKCSDTLKKELNIPPSESTISLYESIRTTQADTHRDSFRRNRDDTNKQSQYTNTENSGYYANIPSVYGLSIAVFPFKNIGKQALEENIGGWIADLLLSSISNFKWISVVPRRVTFEPSSRDLTAAQRYQSINARYILSGDIQYYRSQFRLYIEMTDKINAKIVWNNIYLLNDKEEILERNSEIGKIVSQVDMQLRNQETKRVMTLLPNNYSAYDCVIRAISKMHSMESTKFSEANELFDRAIDIDPDFAAVFTWKIFWEIFSMGQGWVGDREAALSRAKTVIHEALKREPDDALALAFAAHYEAFIKHNFEYALVLFTRSLSLNPHSSFAWMLSSPTFSYIGEPEEGLKRLEYVDQLCSIELYFNYLYNTSKCIAYTIKREYEEAVKWGKQTVDENPFFSNGYKPLIASLGNLERSAEAKNYLSKLLRIEPSFSIEEFSRCYPFKYNKHKEDYIRGLIRAGVPK